MTPDKQLLEAVLRLRAQEFAPFLGYLKAELEDSRDKLTTAPLDRLTNLQGKAQCLKGILDLVEVAPAMLDKMEGR